MQTLPPLLLILLLAVAAPAASQASASEVSAEGRLWLSSPDALMMVNMSRTSFQLEADEAVLTLVDDWSSVHKTPGGGKLVAIEHRRDTETVEMQAVQLHSTGEHSSGVLLIPDTGRDYRREATLHGRLDIGPASDQVVERSHFYTGDGIDPAGLSTSHEYEYRAGQGLALTTSGSAEHAAWGDFTIYLWGVTFTAAHDDGAKTYRTGYYESPSPSDGGSGVLMREHYVHALINVRNGTLTASGSGGALYGDSFALRLDGVALLSRADGALTSAEGNHDLSGGVTVEDGAYDLTRNGADVEIAVREGPASIRGDVTTTGAPSTLLPRGAIASVAAILLVAVGTVYARPTLVAGVGQMRYRRIALDPPPRMTLRELRAEGHRRLAYRAEAHAAYRRAAWHAGRILRIEPDNPGAYTLRGRLLRRLGHYGAAIESHKRAHEWFDALDENKEELAINAYEAARSCALDDRPDDALHWLGIALRGDRELCEGAASEPDFASIRSTTEYLLLVRGWKPDDHPADDLLAP